MLPLAEKSWGASFWSSEILIVKCAPDTGNMEGASPKYGTAGATRKMAKTFNEWRDSLAFL